MSDLVKRLRDAANKSVMDFGEHWNLEDEAADAIERKDAAIAELVGVLRSLVRAKDEKEAHGDTPVYRSLKAGCWESARAAIAKYDDV